MLRMNLIPWLVGGEFKIWKLRFNGSEAPFFLCFKRFWDFGFPSFYP